MTAMLLCLGLAFSGAAFAQEMQERMKDCNARAGDKKGDERKRFMRTCLKAPSAKAAKADKAAGETTESQGLLFKCNQDAGAKGLKGEQRKRFLNACLKGK
jgi:hypothetical protein